MLRAVPDPDPRDSVHHLTKLVKNATETFGADSPIVADLKAKLRLAERTVERNGQARTEA